MVHFQVLTSTGRVALASVITLTTMHGAVTLAYASMTLVFVFQGMTGRLALAMFACVIGSSFLFGYSTGVLNAPQHVSTVQPNRNLPGRKIRVSLEMVTVLSCPNLELSTIA